MQLNGITLNRSISIFLLVTNGSASRPEQRGSKGNRNQATPDGESEARGCSGHVRKLLTPLSPGLASCLDFPRVRGFISSKNKNFDCLGSSRPSTFLEGKSGLLCSVQATHTTCLSRCSRRPSCQAR